MQTIPTSQDICNPTPFGGDIYDFEWCVEQGWKVEYKDGSVAYYPSWHKTPNKICDMQGDGHYKECTVTAWRPK